MSELNEIYEVLEVEGKPGLLVTDHVFLPGRKFSRVEWKWGEDKLKDALDQGRCKKIEKKVEAEEKKEEKKAEKKEESLEELKAKYAELDPESGDARRLARKIEKLEAKS